MLSPSTAINSAGMGCWLSSPLETAKKKHAALTTRIATPESEFRNVVNHLFDFCFKKTKIMPVNSRIDLQKRWNAPSNQMLAYFNAFLFFSFVKTNRQWNDREDEEKEEKEFNKTIWYLKIAIWKKKKNSLLFVTFGLAR